MPTFSGEVIYLRVACGDITGDTVDLARAAVKTDIETALPANSILSEMDNTCVPAIDANGNEVVVGDTVTWRGANYEVLGIGREVGCSDITLNLGANVAVLVTSVEIVE